jgi:hypothetical protein
MRLPARNRLRRPPVPPRFCSLEGHKTQCCAIKREPQPRMDRGMCFAGFEREFARVSKPKKAVPAAMKKICPPPDWGMRADPFVATIQARSSRTASRTLFRHAKRLAGNSWSPSRHGFEVLVNYALNSIELTNQLLRFPRVRQQTRGNFSCQYL